MNTPKDIAIRRFENRDADEVSQLILDDLMWVNSRDYAEHIREMTGFKPQ